MKWEDSEEAVLKPCKRLTPHSHLEDEAEQLLLSTYKHIHTHFPSLPLYFSLFLSVFLSFSSSTPFTTHLPTLPNKLYAILYPSYGWYVRDDQLNYHAGPVSVGW